MLKSGCKRTQNARKTKTFTNIAILKACILSDLCQHSQSSEIQKLVKEKVFPFMAFVQRSADQQQTFVFRGG